MNEFKVTVYISTRSTDPTDWIAESICNNLLEGEELTSITTIQYKEDDQESECN